MVLSLVRNRLGDRENKPMRRFISDETFELRTTLRASSLSPSVRLNLPIVSFKMF